MQPRMKHSLVWSLTAVAAVSAVAAFVTAALLIANHHQFTGNDPMDSQEMRDLREQLRADSGNEMLRGQLHQLDVQLRREYFRRVEFASRGTVLLVGFAIVAAATAAAAVVLARRPGLPRRAGDALDEQLRRQDLAISAVGAVAVLMAAVFGAWAALAGRPMGFVPAWREWVESPHDPPPGPPPATGDTPIAPAAPGDAAPQATDHWPPPPDGRQLLANWGRFRGPGGDGRAVAPGPVPHFDAASGHNILWKAQLPLEGASSPVIWEGRVFVTAADQHTREVYCFSLDDGELLWQAKVATDDSPAMVIPEYTGYAAPTPAVDGRAIYAAFGNGDVGAFSLDGRPLWVRSLGPPDNIYGHASSLAVHGELVYVLMDQGYADAGKSVLLALDASSGRTAWQARRAVAASWATPLVIDTAAGTQLITAADPLVIAHDPLNGRQLWRARTVAGDVAPTPILAGGLVLAITPDSTLFAIRPDGEGDVSDTHVAWQASDGVPDVTSPLSDGELVLMVTTNGVVTCLDIDGATLWEHEFGDEGFHASPLLVGSRAYLLSEDGRMYALEMARELGEVELVGRLGEKVDASPAWLGGRLIVRGVEHLYCIGDK